MGGGVVFAYYHIQTEMVVDMYGGFGFKEYDFLFYVLDAKTVDEHTPEELVDGRAVLDKRLYTLANIDRIGDTIVFD